jgi:hypothetical protein
MNEMRMGMSVEQQGQNLKLPSWIQWTAATAAGYALGMMLSSYLVGNALRPLGPILWGILNVLIYGAVIGISLGIFQFVIMPRGLFPFRGWILATLAGSAIGFAVAAIVCEALGNAMDSSKINVLGEGAVSATAGVIIGLANGLGQWYELRQRLPRARGWIMASVLGTMLGTVMSSVLLGLFELPLLRDSPNLSVGAILGIFAGIFQGLFLQSYRRQDK